MASWKHATQTIRTSAPRVCATAWNRVPPRPSLSWQQRFWPRWPSGANSRTTRLCSSFAASQTPESAAPPVLHALGQLFDLRRLFHDIDRQRVCIGLADVFLQLFRQAQQLVRILLQL